MSDGHTFCHEPQGTTIYRVQALQTTHRGVPIEKVTVIKHRKKGGSDSHCVLYVYLKWGERVIPTGHLDTQAQVRSGATQH